MMSDTLPPARIAILMTTFNGERYLPAQLESLRAQSWADWVLYVSDDGSSDDTAAILSAFRERMGAGRVVLRKGPGQGFAANFMSLVRDPAVQGDFFAFCDQDDHWHPGKLERGLRRLTALHTSGPALYCSRTRLVDQDGHPIGFSPLFRRPPCFRNALVQSLAGANTMLLDRQARELLMAVSPDATVVSHDWLAYLVVTGCGGEVIYDPLPTLDYRQHGKNLVGSNSSWQDRLRRTRRMLQGTFREWNRQNLAALADVSDRLTPESLAVLGCFERARSGGALRRLQLLAAAGVFRQTALGNMGLALAAGIGRI